MSDFRGCQSRVNDTPLRLGQVTLNHAAMTDLDTFWSRFDTASVRFRGEADMDRQAKPVESVENDPQRHFTAVN